MDPFDEAAATAALQQPTGDKAAAQDRWLAATEGVIDRVDLLPGVTERTLNPENGEGMVDFTLRELLED